MKKIISLLLIVMMLLSCVSVSFADTIASPTTLDITLTANDSTNLSDVKTGDIINVKYAIKMHDGEGDQYGIFAIQNSITWTQDMFEPVDGSCVKYSDSAFMSFDIDSQGNIVHATDMDTYYDKDFVFGEFQLKVLKAGTGTIKSTKAKAYDRTNTAMTIRSNTVTVKVKGTEVTPSGGGGSAREITDNGVIVVPTPAIEVETDFKDVKTTDYFAEAVSWAVSRGITTGRNKTTFDPFATCSRAEAVTFLWRAAGSPEPKSIENPFYDVKESDFYYKAVLWALENNITKGVYSYEFGSNDTVTRVQMITLLQRANNGIGDLSNISKFADVTEKDYFASAVAWGVEKGITTGTTSCTFSPYSGCERCQIVTFLYRADK